MTNVPPSAKLKKGCGRPDARQDGMFGLLGLKYIWLKKKIHFVEENKLASSKLR